jgi:hypothetical protein
MHDKLCQPKNVRKMFRELMAISYNDIADGDVAFVNMSIRETKWRQFTKNNFTGPVSYLTLR